MIETDRDQWPEILLEVEEEEGESARESDVDRLNAQLPIRETSREHKDIECDPGERVEIYQGLALEIDDGAHVYFFVDGEPVHRARIGEVKEVHLYRAEGELLILCINSRVVWQRAGGLSL